MKEEINRSYEEIVDKISRIICDECVIEFEEGCSGNYKTCIINKEERKWLSGEE